MKIFKNVLVIFIALILTLTIPFSSESLESAISGVIAEFNIESKQQSASDVPSYTEYLKMHDSAEIMGEIINLKSIDSDYGANSKTYEGETAVFVGNDESVMWEFDNNKEGLYRIHINYNTSFSQSINYEMSFSVNGEIPYSYANSIILPKAWSFDIEDGNYINRNGIDIKPPQMEKALWNNHEIKERDGYYKEGLMVYLPKGTNTLEIKFFRGEIYVESLILGNLGENEDYDSVFKDYEDSGIKPLSKSDVSDIIIEGEYPSYRSDTTIMPAIDRTSVVTSTNHPVNLYFNTIGQQTWKDFGQKITWEIDAEKEGLYKLDMRVRQNLARGMSVARQLKINGRIVSKQQEMIHFDYSNKWYIKTIGDRNPYLVYLEEGDNTISLEVVSNLGGILINLDNTVRELNSIYREIIMITGTNPDSNRDYRIENSIPDLLSRLETLNVGLSKVYDDMILSGFKEGGEIVVIKNTLRFLASIIDQPFTIPNRLQALVGNTGGVSALITTLTYQPLEIDYIRFSGYDSEPLKENGGFFESLWFEIRKFLATYYKDYNSLELEQQSDSILTVWVNSGRDQAETIKNMVDQQFASQNNIPVKVNLIQQGLIPATLAGTGPDITLFASMIDTVNLATRNTLYDFTDFSDFGDEKKKFSENSTNLYTFLDGCFGIPITESFYMMFYRQDIFNELGIEIPETWDEMKRVSNILQRKNLTVGIPQGVQIGELIQNTMFECFLFQNGGNYYEGDAWFGSGISSPQAIEAARTYTEFYTKYGFPVAYDPYTRFRNGEMPLLINTYVFYSQLMIGAPEIRGDWKMVPIPGTVKDDGSVDRSVSGFGTAAIMFNKTENKEDAWTFIKWFTDNSTQAEYGNNIEIILGPGARYETANVEALRMLPWSREEADKLLSQKEDLKMIRLSPVTYYVNRNVTNAMRNIIYNSEKVREVMNRYNYEIDAEIQRKINVMKIDTGKGEE